MKEASTSVSIAVTGATPAALEELRGDIQRCLEQRSFTCDVVLDRNRIMAKIEVGDTGDCHRGCNVVDDAFAFWKGRQRPTPEFVRTKNIFLRDDSEEDRQQAAV